MSDNCRDIIKKVYIKISLNQLLDKDPETRLGSVGGTKEVLKHPFFADIDPDMVLTKAVRPST